MKKIILITMLMSAIYGQVKGGPPMGIIADPRVSLVKFLADDFSFDDGEINGFSIPLEIDANFDASISFETENNPIGVFLVGLKGEDGKYLDDRALAKRRGETSLRTVLNPEAMPNSFTLELEVDATCATPGDYFINLNYRVLYDDETNSMNTPYGQIQLGEGLEEGVNTTKVTIASKGRLAPLYECLEPNALNFLAESELSQLFDTDGNGSISPAEYYRLVESAGGN
jgi:hypothetical protein